MEETKRNEQISLPNSNANIANNNQDNLFYKNNDINNNIIPILNNDQTNQQDQKNEKIYESLLLLNNLSNYLRNIDENIKNDNNFEKYYLINVKWIRFFKSVFPYSIICSKQNSPNEKEQVLNTMKNADQNNLNNLYNNKTLFKVNFKNSENNMFGDYPSNFYLITENLYKIFKEIFKLELENKCDVLFKGGKIFIKDMKKKEKIFICDIKNNNNDAYNIQYILLYNKESIFEEEIKTIKDGNFDNYLKERNLTDNTNKFQDIIDENGNNLGVLLKNEIQSKNNDSNMKNKEEINNNFIYLIILSLANIEELKQYFLNQNKKENAPFFNVLLDMIKNNNTNIVRNINELEKKLNEQNPKIKKCENLDKLLNIILFSLHSELINCNNRIDNNDFNSKTKEYDEKNALQNFRDRNSNDSIIKNLFFIEKETSIKCSKCSLQLYYFEYINHIFLQHNNNSDMIKQFEIDEHEEIDCNQCAGLFDGIKKIRIYSSNKIIIFSFGDIINDNNNNCLSLNIKLSEDENKKVKNYSLFMSIGYINNDNGLKIIFKDENNKWNYYEDCNKNQFLDNINSLKPILLFYRCIEEYPESNENYKSNENMKNNDDKNDSQNRGQPYNINDINFNDNNIFNNNYASCYNNNNFENNNINEEISLYFNFNDNDIQIFIDTFQNNTISEIIKQIKAEYPWIKNITCIKYNGEILESSKTAKNCNLRNDSKCVIFTK